MSNTFPKFPKITKATWQSILANPLIFGIMVIPLDSENTLALISGGLLLVGVGLIPLQIQRIPLSASIACGIMFTLGCVVGGFALANVLEYLFPDFPTVKQWKWVQPMPSAFGNLGILIWVFVVLNISPVNRPLVIGTSFVAAAAGYALALDAVVIREVLIFDRTREITSWEQGMVTLLDGGAMIVWERLIVRKLISFSVTKSVGDLTLFLGMLSILLGIFMILRTVF